MFTGLIEEIGTIKAISPLGGGKTIEVSAKKILDDVKVDDSVSIEGVCQTVVSVASTSFVVEAVEETLRKTNFNKLSIGKKVNLERAMRLNDRLGGHLVQGHADCTGTIRQIRRETTGILIQVAYPSEYAKYLVRTGSVCVNGVSLTIARLDGGSFTVSIIPHTFNNTSFQFLKNGDSVNLEFDIIGKYLEKLLAGGQNNNFDYKESD
jgi:riboflavin synthase